MSVAALYRGGGSSVAWSADRAGMGMAGNKEVDAWEKERFASKKHRVIRRKSTLRSARHRHGLQTTDATPPPSLVGGADRQRRWRLHPLPR